MFVVAFYFIIITPDAKSEECLSYEPAIVRLTGAIVERTFPGPPNYESIKKGDAPEMALILELNRPVCVKGDPDDEVNSETEKNVKSMHLVIHDGKYTYYRRLLSKQVVANGTLFHAHTGHHRTKVLMEVIGIKTIENGNKK